MADQEIKEKEKEKEEKIREAAGEEISEKAGDEISEAVADAAEEVKEEAAAADAASGDMANGDKPAMKASTEANRRKKAERREAKAARKEANRIEEKKKRPSNTLLAVLIFGVVIVMFAFAGGYNYFQKPANIEKYVSDQGIANMYKDTPVSENVTLSVTGEGNTLKIDFTASKDAAEDELKKYTGDDGTGYLKDIGSSFLTSIKPKVRGFGGEVIVSIKQGDETLNDVKMTYSEAKKYIKEAEKKAAEEAEDKSDDASDDTSDDADAGSDAETKTDTEDSGE